MSWNLELSLPMLTLGLSSFLPPYPLVLSPLPLPAPPVLASSPLLPPQKDGEDEGEGGEGSRERGFTIDFIHYFMTPSCCMAGHDWGNFSTSWEVLHGWLQLMSSHIFWITFALWYSLVWRDLQWTVHYCWIQTKRILSISKDNKLLSVQWINRRLHSLSVVGSSWPCTPAVRSTGRGFLRSAIATFHLS